MYTGAGVVIKVHVCRVEGVGVASIVGSEMIPLRRNVFSESVQTDVDHYTSVSYTHLTLPTKA